MPRGRTLLERLADPRGEEQRTTRLDTEALAESVLQHLQRLLNTRRGSALTAEDYGVPELSEFVHSFPEAILELQRAIKACIEKYEPRLEHVVIKHVPSENDLLTVRFEVTARLVADRQRQPIWFETTIDSSGETRIKR